MKRLDKILTKEFLYQEYIINNKPAREIIKQTECNKSTFFYYLKKYKIKKEKIFINCLECGKKFKIFYCNMETAKFCSKKCFGKWQSKNKRGKNSSRYIDGRTNKEYFCKCGRKINVHTALYGSGECIHCFNKYRIFTTKTLQKMKKSHMGLFKGEKHPLFGTHPSKNTRKKLSKASLEYWQNKEYREKTIQASMLGRSLAPNVPEKELNKLLGNDYKFVGDGKVILGGFNPDFINCNGQKKIVELYGCYWHKCKTCGFGNGKRPIDAGRLKEYKKLGYSTLIVWEHELKDIDKLTNRLMEFNGDKLCKK